MKTVITSLLLLISLSFSISAQNTIEWSKDKKLTWDNFKGVPNEEILAYASTAYKIEILPSDVEVDTENNIKNYESLTVVANFYCNLSWVHTKSDFLLKHEQLHFDIAGLYAYKMKLEFQKLKDQKNANFDSYLNVYKKLWAECKKTQQAYDDETNHGQRIKENEDWIKKINKELATKE